MKLTKDVTLSLELMNRLKNRTAPARVAELATDLGTTQHYLEQIVNKLRRGGVIAVKRGPGGGISRASQEPMSVTKILTALGKGVNYKPAETAVEGQPTPVRSKEDEILEKVAQVLAQETC